MHSCPDTDIDPSFLVYQLMFFTAFVSCSLRSIFKLKTDYTESLTAELQNTNQILAYPGLFSLTGL